MFSSVSCTRKYLLNDLFVVPSARRGGTARALLVAAADFARAQGAASLSLSTGVNNAAAQSLYERALETGPGPEARRAIESNLLRVKGAR